MQSSEKLHSIYIKPASIESNTPESLIVRHRMNVSLADTAHSKPVRTRLDVLEEERAVIIDSRPETD